MSIFFLINCRDDEIHQHIARSPAPEQALDIMLDGRKQAGANHAVGGQPNAAAMAAERLCDRIDESYFARRAVGESPPPGGFAQVFRFDPFERVYGLDT